MIIVPAKPSIGYPDICRFPVENRISIEDIISDFRSPPVIMIHLIFPGKVNTAPAIETFLRTNTYEKAGSYRIFSCMQPFGKMHLKLVVPHCIRIKREVLYGHTAFRHFPYPYITLLRVPRTPIILIHRCTGGYLERYAHAIYIQNILIGFQNTVHVIDSHAILDFIIHVVNTKFTLQIIATDVINT